MSEQSLPSPAPIAALPRPPVTRGLPIVGSLPAFLRRPFDFLLEARARYGDLYTMDAGFMRLVVLNHPRQLEHVLQDHSRNYVRGGVLYESLRAFSGDGLIASDGEHWLRQRRMMQPHFHRRHLAGLVDLMVETITQELDAWAPAAARGEPISLLPAYSRITMKVIVRAIFGAALTDAEISTLSEEIAYVLDHLFLDALAKSLPGWLPIPGIRRYRRARAVVDATLYDVIARARRGDGGEGSLMAMMLQLVDAETGAGMTDQQLRDEAVSLVLAGFETTALTLAWLGQLLARHPEVLARLQAEVDALGGGPPALADLRALPYAAMVIQETMRLYPAAWVYPRQAVGDDVIDGYAIKAGSLIAILPYGIHHNPELWEDPERFDPERFDPERFDPERHRYAWVAFGLGQHQCLGKDFALMEMQLILALLLQRYGLEAAPGPAAVPELSSTLRPRGGVMVRLTARPRGRNEDPS